MSAHEIRMLVDLAENLKVKKSLKYANVEI
jgi:hypothetical protein